MKTNSFFYRYTTPDLLKAVSVFTLLFCFCNQVFTQSQNIKPTYVSWVKLKGSDQKIKAHLHKADETSLQILNKNFKNSGFMYQHIPFDEIQSVEFRKKGSVGKGALVGSILGFGIGYSLGYLSGDDEEGWISFSAQDKGLMLGTLAIIPGAIIGAIVGSSKVTIPLNKKRPDYQKNIEKLKAFGN